MHLLKLAKMKKTFIILLLAIVGVLSIKGYSQVTRDNEVIAVNSEQIQTVDSGTSVVTGKAMEGLNRFVEFTGFMNVTWSHIVMIFVGLWSINQCIEN